MTYLVEVACETQNEWALVVEAGEPLVQLDTEKVDMLSEQPEIAPTASRLRASALGTARFALPRILVVEDTPINQQVARGMLARLGYGADLVSDGLEALEALSRGSYAAILMDCHMPRMDGFEASRELRLREGGTSHTPIIAMTASAMGGQREKCLAAGMDDYLAKPVRLPELEAALRRWTGADAQAGGD